MIEKEFVKFIKFIRFIKLISPRGKKDKS